jgi:hypothetical protein
MSTYEYEQYACTYSEKHMAADRLNLKCASVLEFFEHLMAVRRVSSFQPASR